MRGVRKEAIIQLQSGIVSIEGHMKFERAVFVAFMFKIYFHFRLLQLNQ
jgi:hypothetical protein